MKTYIYKVRVSGVRIAHIQADSLGEAKEIVEDHGNERLFDDEYAVRRFGDGLIEIVSDDNRDMTEVSEWKEI
jgi:hypothetical protein|tara:strand:- start:47 stop:265 length:219 start_codon:yes stop_codon:yes gene_type:complete